MISSAMTVSLVRFRMHLPVIPQTIAETVLADVKRHLAGAEQSDDITLLAVCYHRANTKS